MGGILTGFLSIGLGIAAGYLAPRLGIVGPGTHHALNRLAFFVAAPALLFMVVADADLSVILQAPLLVQIGATAGSGLLFLLVNRVWLRLRGADATVGAYAASYINAANIGIPVSVYVLGNPAASVPVILLQVLILGPLALVLLDSQTTGQRSWRFVLMQPVRNPIIAASALGAVVSLTGWVLPSQVYAPLRLLGGAAVPMQLLAFGMSLYGSRLLGPESFRRAAVVAAFGKTVVMPAIAFVLARFVFRMDDAMVFAAVVLAGLPTAQNVYNYSARFGRGDILARDTIMLSTLASPLVLITAALLLT